jgi:putative ABC transport system permease protein
MKIKDTIKTSFGGLTTHKSRSLLTILGIVIGITSIILVMSIGESAQELILGQINQFGSNNVSIHPGRRAKDLTGFVGMLSNDSLKIRDYEELQKKSNVPNAISVVPYVYTSETIAYGSDTYSSFILGSVPEAIKSFKLEVANGMFFTDSDVASRSAVVVIGSKIAKDLFGAANPIGQSVKIKNKNFRIIGVIAPKGQLATVNIDELAIAPYPAIQQYILGTKHFHEIIVETDSVDSIPAVVKDIERTLRTSHNITDPSKDDFQIQTQADAANTVGTIINILTLLLSSVAAISLVVGGVGIMNIMLVSVTERTREIGLRKALGATNKDILNQFLYEAVMLTLSGGVVGIILGTSLGWLISIAARQFAGLDFPFVFSFQGAILGVGVAMIIGLGFGIFPARQAAQKNPIDSLRYE